MFLYPLIPVTLIPSCSPQHFENRHKEVYEFFKRTPEYPVNLRLHLPLHLSLQFGKGSPQLGMPNHHARFKEEARTAVASFFNVPSLNTS